MTTSESDLSACQALPVVRCDIPILRHPGLAHAGHPWVHHAYLPFASIWMKDLSFIKLGGVFVEIVFSFPFTDTVCFITVLYLKLCWQLGCSNWGRWTSSWWSLVGFSRFTGVSKLRTHFCLLVLYSNAVLVFAHIHQFLSLFSCNFSEIRNFQRIKMFITFWSRTVMYHGQSILFFFLIMTFFKPSYACC